jgi:soluble lytic murein transglycosylase-like protein
MPGTARYLGFSPSDRSDPEKNIEMGTKYLSQMIRVQKEITLGLAAYNAGPGNVRKYKGVPPFKETQDYIRIILQWYKDPKRKY